LRLGRLQYFISQFCNTKNLLRPQKKWLKISLKSENVAIILGVDLVYRRTKWSLTGK
jgi:hypothetical protein